MYIYACLHTLHIFTYTNGLTLETEEEPPIIGSPTDLVTPFLLSMMSKDFSSKCRLYKWPVSRMVEVMLDNVDSCCYVCMCVCVCLCDNVDSCCEYITKLHTHICICVYVCMCMFV